MKSACLTMVAEATIICVDNSGWGQRKDSSSKMRHQANAIELYIYAKIQCNPENIVGVHTMAGRTIHQFLLEPTNNLTKIRTIRGDLDYNSCSGMMNVVNALDFACTGFKRHANEKLKRRIILFAGGVIKHGIESLEKIGNFLKKENIALDVVTFGENDEETLEKLKALVAAVNSNDDSHIVHVPSASSICQAILSPPIFPRFGQSNERMLHMVTTMLNHVHEMNKIRDNQLVRLEEEKCWSKQLEMMGEQLSPIWDGDGAVFIE